MILTRWTAGRPSLCQPVAPGRPGALAPRRAVRIATTAQAQQARGISRREMLAGVAAGVVLGNVPALTAAGQAAGERSIFDFSVRQYGKHTSLDAYEGKSSKSVRTRRQLLETYPDKFTVIAFPCDQFGGQAPLGDEGEREAAYKKIGIRSFPVMDTVEVNGPGADPLYKYLKATAPVSIPGSAFTRTSDLLWNYEKFLCDQNGVPVKRFKSPFNPADFEGDIKLLLAGKAPTPEECVAHPGRRVCKVDKLLAEG